MGSFPALHSLLHGTDGKPSFPDSVEDVLNEEETVCFAKLPPVGFGRLGST